MHDSRTTWVMGQGLQQVTRATLGDEDVGF